ncbi:MAG: hypothetical protein HXY34_04975 [Candidatus Thorarchaeota archaeon]|nr:hypothetical protein [Candidatus Thorarchaeota archaeon]
MTPQSSDDTDALLRRAIAFVHRLERQVTSINSHLRPTEDRLRAERFRASGELTISSGPAFVLAATAIQPNDPLGSVLSRVTGETRVMPNIVSVTDSRESKDTCQRLVKAIRAQAQDARDKRIAVYNLRWAYLVPFHEKKETVIVGKTFLKADRSYLDTLESKLRTLGVQVIYDRGTYGGGPLTYELCEEFRDNPNATVVELTLSHTLASSRETVLGILTALSSL